MEGIALSTSIVSPKKARNKSSGPEKARRFSVVSTNLPIPYVVAVLNEKHRPAGHSMRKGDRLPVHCYLTVRHEEGGTHVLIETVNPIRLETVAGWFNEYRVQVKAIKGATPGSNRRAWAEAIKYVTHEGTIDKVIHPDHAVHASAGWDWRALIEWLEGRDRGLPSLLDRLEKRVGTGELTHWQVFEGWQELYLKNPGRWQMLDEVARKYTAHKEMQQIIQGRHQAHLRNIRSLVRKAVAEGAPNNVADLVKHIGWLNVKASAIREAFGIRPQAT